MAVVRCSIWRNETAWSIFAFVSGAEQFAADTNRKEIAMLFAALIERVRIWRRERETLAELRRLTDRDLTDIGIHPADIEAIARRAARA